MNILDLPINLLEDILKYVNDTTGYESLRISCKLFYNLLPVVKRFHDDGALYAKLFFENHIPIKNHIYYHKNGCKMSTIKYENGKKIYE